MKKGFVLLFSLLVFGLMIVGTVWRNANSFAQMVSPPREDDDGGGTTTLTWKLDSIDEKAEQAKNNDEAAVRALADEVFKSPELAIIPTEDMDAMKARVLTHELAYRSGNSEGIREENIVLTVNELVDKFKAPDFARTSALQVRVLRACLMHEYPNFIAQETGEERSSEATIGDSVSPTMSPLEALYVTGVMLWQKMLNKDYQYTPQEWVYEVYNKNLEQWQADLSGNFSDEQNSTQPQYRLGGVSENNEKRRQMMDAVITGAATLLSPGSQGLPDSTSLYDDTLTTLGINQKEGL